MNAKEEILKMLKDNLDNYVRLIKYDDGGHLFCISKEAFETLKLKTEYLISATEAAIFNVPSSDQVEERADQYGTYAHDSIHFVNGCNFVLNYDKWMGTNYDKWMGTPAFKSEDNDRV